MSETIRIIRLSQVKGTTGLCRSVIYQLEADGKFPNRVRLGARSVGWVESEVQRWIAERIEASRTKKSRGFAAAPLPHGAPRVLTRSTPAKRRRAKAPYFASSSM